jgi:hypothetical protein
MQPLEAALRLFRGDFERHVADGVCSYRRPGPDAPAAEGSVS